MTIYFLKRLMCWGVFLIRRRYKRMHMSLCIGLFDPQCIFFSGYVLGKYHFMPLYFISLFKLPPLCSPFLLPIMQKSEFSLAPGFNTEFLCFYLPNLIFPHSSLYYRAHHSSLFLFARSLLSSFILGPTLIYLL